jgi:hypothetical protein
VPRPHFKRLDLGLNTESILVFVQWFRDCRLVLCMCRDSGKRPRIRGLILKL